jgi:hypothetical protein
VGPVDQRMLTVRSEVPPRVVGAWPRSAEHWHRSANHPIGQLMQRIGGWSTPEGGIPSLCIPICILDMLIAYRYFMERLKCRFKLSGRPSANGEAP